jgi:DNA-directed RNA polymerase subunit RPC12/RpoP
MLSAARHDTEGHLIGSPNDFAAWLATCGEDELAEPFTFVIGVDGALRLAPRRSEHVACAAGAPVLSAGEITFVHDQGQWRVSEISNQSAGYCPDLASWPAVSDALDRVGLEHPYRFTYPVVFRRCPRCQERNLVKDDDFACAICGAELPRTWNVAQDV